MMSGAGGWALSPGRTACGGGGKGPPFVSISIRSRRWAPPLVSMACRSRRWAPPLVSWPGLARPSTTLRQVHRKVLPFGIPGVDQSNLPCSRPPLHGSLAPDGIRDVGVRFVIDQTMQLVAAGEYRAEATLVPRYASRKIARHADKRRSVRSVGDDVYPASGHRRELDTRKLTNRLRGRGSRPGCNAGRYKVVDGRAKPGHDTVLGPGQDTAIETGRDTVWAAGLDAIRPATARFRPPA